MTESEMFKRLKRCSMYYPVTFERVETGSITISIPDVYYFTPNITGWLELKVIKYLERKKEFHIPYRPGQIGWLTKHHRTNKKTFCLGYFDNYYYLFDKFVKYVENIDNLCVWKGLSLKSKELYMILFYQGG